MVLLDTVEKNREGKEVHTIVAEALNQAIALAREEFDMQFEGEYPINGFGLQELRPFHVENTTSNIPQTSNLNYWQTSQLTGSTWTDWINVTSDTDQVLLIAGLFNLEPNPDVTEIFPSANGVDLPVINVEQMYALQVGRAFFEKPFIVKPKANITIQLYGRTSTSANTSQRIGLIGYALAKRSRLIDKS